jgi:Ca2+-binding RTX toxin-like protein
MQFEALRDGDRLWFENQGFDAKTLNAIENTTLADIILRDTDTDHYQDDAFVFYQRVSGLAGGVEPEDPDAPLLVIGADGKDTLIGGSQGDYLFAGTGKQTLTGGEGADKFVFGKGATKAKITDFQVDVDKLVFENAGKLDLHDVHIKSNHSDAVVTVGSDQITLVGVNGHHLNAHDFIFTA